MDPSSVLEQTVQDVSNLQAEFHHLLEEIKYKDLELTDVKKKVLQQDGQIQKHLKQQGSLSALPNEEELYGKIREGLHECEGIQKDKCTLANTILFLVSKHLGKLEKNIDLLEEDGLLAPLEGEGDSGSEVTRSNSVTSITSERKRKVSSPADTAPIVKKKRQQIRGNSAKPYPSSKPGQDKNGMNGMVDGGYELQVMADDLFSAYNNNEEEEDKTLYCFCQSVSYGEMVACDGRNCKYEWFHYSCVNLKEPPKGAWYCPDCTQELAKSNLRRKRV